MGLCWKIQTTFVTTIYLLLDVSHKAIVASRTLINRKYNSINCGFIPGNVFFALKIPIYNENK